MKRQEAAWKGTPWEVNWAPGEQVNHAQRVARRQRTPPRSTSASSTANADAARGTLATHAQPYTLEERLRHGTCRKWKVGVCTVGDKCFYAHEYSEQEWEEWNREKRRRR